MLSILLSSLLELLLPTGDAVMIRLDALKLGFCCLEQQRLAKVGRRIS